MTVFINDKTMEFGNGKYLADIIPELNIKDLKGIAIAVNYHVISRDKWNQYLLKDQDKIQ